MRKNTAQTLPATDLPLTGHALIEASAGTGKTWTLTGILLRLLVERGIEPRNIVATTFTRAAASEMRHRVQERVETFRTLLVALIRAYGETPELLEDDAQLTARVMAWLASQGEAGKDAVNAHILQHAMQGGVDGLLATYRCTLLALQSLDQMFTGTLDSLCQRWLRELALESGVEHIRINTAPDAVAQLSHDHLRAFYQQEARHNAERFAAFYTAASGKAENYVRNSRTTLNYGAARFVPLPAVADELPDVPAALAHVSLTDVEDALALIAGFVQNGWLSGKTNLFVHFAHLTEAFASLSRGEKPQGDALKALEGLGKALAAAAEGGSPFNNSASPEQRMALARHPALQALHAAATALAARDEQLHLLRLHSLQANSEYVRSHLGETLRHSGETTYGELLARLNATLQDNPALCRYLAHRYPVLLVDEAQDLSHAQSTLLRHIYGNFEHSEHGFWLLVGDPKQAIYRFRGSDVQNYTRLKADIPRHENLEDNYRSSPALVDTLNRYYLHDADSAALGENIAYQSVQAAKAERPVVMRDGSPVSEPVQWIAIDKADEEPAAIVRLVQHLTGYGSRWLRKDEDGYTPLERRDIMILARGNSNLQTLETALTQAHIDCERQADQNLFAQAVAQEMAWLLAALIEPGNSAVVRRLLAGRFYGFDLQTIDALSGSETLAQFHRQLGRAGERWGQSGLLAALQSLWREDPWDGNIWTRLAAQPYPASMRDLLDLRRLQEIIAAYEQPPRRFLDWWRVQLASPPDGEWALCLPLPGSNAVRLMTIHKAKGLQAPVVILAGMSRPNNHGDDDVEAFHCLEELWLATGKTDDPGIQAQIDAESAAENRRLLYVALTRAEDLLFIAKRKDHYCFDPLKILCANNAIVPQGLDDIISVQTDRVDWASPAPTAPHPTLLPLPDPGLRGWRKTSFSALASGIPAAGHDLAVHDTLDLELTRETLEPAENTPAAFSFAFPRGPQAGSFLHEALEKIRWPRRPHWPVFFRRLLAKHHLPELENHIPELDKWFAAILNAPLTSGATLAHLQEAERELGFSLALDASRPLPVRALREHFAAWGKTLPLADNRSLYKYLRGEIDLVYRHNGRFYVLDYKSNHLGDSPQDYRPAAMQRAMDDHHYWLQAALYQVALHRLLKTRLPDYQPEQHLGSVEYYFIRAAQDNACGHLSIDIPADWLLHLDSLLGGTHNESQR